MDEDLSHCGPSAPLRFSASSWILRASSKASIASYVHPIGGKVESVEVEDTFEGTAGGAREEAAAILGPEEARAVVGAALDSPLVKVSPGPFRYLVVFHLEDGTRSLRWYEPRSGELYLSEDPGEDASYTGVVMPRDVRASLRPAPRGGG